MFTDTELQDAGAQTISDVVRMMPGLSMETEVPMWQGISYRGIGKSTFTGKNPVVIFMDGIPLDSRTDWESDLFNYVASHAGEAHSCGIEIQARARPLPGLDFVGAFAWTDAEFDEYTGFEGNTPEYTLFLSAQYRHETGFFVRGEMERYGTTYYDAANRIERDAIELFNAKIGYENDSWDLYVYTGNLFDREYFSRMSSFSNMVGAPRETSVMVSVRF